MACRQVLPDLEALLARRPGADAEIAAVHALGALGGPRNVPPLQGVLGDQGRHPEVRQGALVALARIGTPEALATVDLALEPVALGRWAGSRELLIYDGEGKLQQLSPGSEGGGEEEEERPPSSTPGSDTDGDGICDGIEERVHLHPQDADTDGDGAPDGADLWPNLDARPPSPDSAIRDAVFRVYFFPERLMERRAVLRLFTGDASLRPWTGRLGPTIVEPEDGLWGDGAVLWDLHREDASIDPAASDRSSALLLLSRGLHRDVAFRVRLVRHGERWYVTEIEPLARSDHRPWSSFFE